MVVGQSDWSHERVLLEVDVVVEHERLSTDQHATRIYDEYAMLAAVLTLSRYVSST